MEQLPGRLNAKVGVAKIYVEPKSRTTICQIVNLSDRLITLPTRTEIATIFPATLLPAAHNHSTVSPETSLNHITSSPFPTPSHQQKVEELKGKGFRFSVDHLTPDQFSQLVDVLHDFRHVFATELHEMPGLKDYQYDIRLKDGAKPVRPRQYRRRMPAQQKIIQEQLDEWEQAGIIKEGTLTWTHPLVLVKKRPINPQTHPNIVYV